ncbi:hypothetical protein MKW98_029733 [Papaver atlanticum]|uniref:Uncharacterized protein n=1 Tax=Papaver atlanticum TaxID=357466 RepID=A0AAD4T6L8_9MAGN|nr:hypothetical protein MKW98_029733 [Papaver atlanticum]
MEAFHHYPFINKHKTAKGQNGEMMSPKRVCVATISVLQSAFARPNRPNSGGWGETCAETGIKVIFRTVRQRVKICGDSKFNKPFVNGCQLLRWMLCPSKDITAINNRVNGKIANGRLNFDNGGVPVSDSFVVMWGVSTFKTAIAHPLLLLF